MNDSTAPLHVFITNSDRYYISLFSLIHKNVKNKSIHFHIKSFLYPKDILLMTQAVIFFKNNDCSVTLVTEDDVIFNYLNSIGIIDFCKTNYDSPSTISAISSLSAMPIRRVNRENMNEYILATQNYFQSICQEKDLTMLDNCLSELINNVYDHAYSPTDAYVFSQFYPQINQIVFAIGDLGIGIAESVNNYRLENNKKLLTPIECVKWAIEENNTTQSLPHNKGKGLDNINSFVNINKGSWELYTNGVRLVKYPSSSNRYQNNPIINFKGTLIQIKIMVNNLEELEIIDNLEW